MFTDNRKHWTYILETVIIEVIVINAIIVFIYSLIDDIIKQRVVKKFSYGDPQR